MQTEAAVAGTPDKTPPTPDDGHSRPNMCLHEPGYLYAVMPEGGDPTRIKLGSTGYEDPVHALKHAYSRAYGRTRVLWLLPCGDMHRDEKERMHAYFGDRRLFPKSEIFTFVGVEEVLNRLADFEDCLTAMLGDEPCPPRITDLEGASSTAARREAAHERRQADKRKRSVEREEAEEHRRATRP